MKILHLTLKKKWFDMIASGEKKEEYREIKPYWLKRLHGKEFDAICFRNGYSKGAPWMLVEVESFFSGLGILDWGAPPNKHVFTFRLGRILETGEPALLTS